ncbi:GDSL-type esterase/lipase family protein [Gramella sp. MAR_2010_147]|uniref:SGNH/GDSL hydrolase family protein n=1 Tax=Gramella sp. MAR_2010_147 TaxID=1250205 RepID=UPI00087B11EA|nr:GDSL-type esterase/lipase family protein [Gramella sp. MAR_2010_147]SDS64198.1 Lysophospholipase L1 [Gramella sp. MAR_2010_147]
MFVTVWRIFIVVVLGVFFSLHQVTAQKITVINAGISGDTTVNLLNRINADVLELNPDVVIIMVGTNDMLNTKNMISYSEYEHNLGLLLKHLNTHNIRTLLVSPPPVDANYLYKRHDKTLYDHTPNDKLDSVAHFMRLLSLNNNALFVDINRIFKDKEVPDHNRDLYIKNELNSEEEDGVHPTAKGYRLIAKEIFQVLKNESWLKPGSTILCLGDSITYGKNVPGQGTANGKTYPAFLKDYIQD